MADDAVANGLRRQGRLRRRDRRSGSEDRLRQAMSDNRPYDEAKFRPPDGAGRQVGSSFKVTTLGTVLQNGYSRHDQVDGASPCTVPGFGREGTRNAEGDGGLMTIDAAATGSVNCALVRMSTTSAWKRSSTWPRRWACGPTSPAVSP